MAPLQQEVKNALLSLEIVGPIPTVVWPPRGLAYRKGCLLTDTLVATMDACRPDQQEAWGLPTPCQPEPAHLCRSTTATGPNP
eukprot:7936127-Lingulodinium_polyedra.AAC.1